MKMVFRKPLQMLVSKFKNKLKKKEELPNGNLHIKKLDEDTLSVSMNPNRQVKDTCKIMDF